MKKISSLFAIILLICSFPASAQQAPVWTKNLDTSPDSANLYPVKTLVDQNDNIYVLSNYQKNTGGPAPVNKIYLYKCNSSGLVLWNLQFDNANIGRPVARDMVLDANDNCYIAGSLILNQNIGPLLLKVSDAGAALWSRDSVSAFSDNGFEQILMFNNTLILGGNSGIAVFNSSGSELWSESIFVQRLALDHAGRIFVSTFPNPVNTLHCYDMAGNILFSDSTLIADRMVSDSRNNIYLLAQWPDYRAAKLDSAGVHQWNFFTAIQNLSFGDQGFDILCDYNNDILLVGLADTMIKLRSDGSMLWKKPMQGTDNYIIDSKIYYSNFIAVAGSLSDSLSTGVSLSLYDLNGNRSWFGIYQSNNIQEFTRSMTFNVDALYILEDSVGTSSLIKFASPFFNSGLDFNLICVDSIWYEPGNNQLINVRVFNGNATHLNYPSVQIVSPNGDTISNPNNLVNFFAHLGNWPQVYQDTILDPNITDFSNYTFLMSDGLGDTTAKIMKCFVQNVSDYNFANILFYPNPVKSSADFVLERECKNCKIEIISIDGRTCYQTNLVNKKSLHMELGSLKSGLYFLRLSGEDYNTSLRFLKL